MGRRKRTQRRNVYDDMLNPMDEFREAFDDFGGGHHHANQGVMDVGAIDDFSDMMGLDFGPPRPVRQPKQRRKSTRIKLPDGRTISISNPNQSHVAPQPFPGAPIAPARGGPRPSRARMAQPQKMVLRPEWQLLADTGCQVGGVALGGIRHVLKKAKEHREKRASIYYEGPTKKEPPKEQPKITISKNRTMLPASRGKK